MFKRVSGGKVLAGRPIKPWFYFYVQSVLIQRYRLVDKVGP